MGLTFECYDVKDLSVMLTSFFSFHSDIEDIDLFAGGLSEDPLSGAVVGPTFACLLARQFRSIKFGDRFWYETPDGPGAFKHGMDVAYE